MNDTKTANRKGTTMKSMLYRRETAKITPRRDGEKLVRMEMPGTTMKAYYFQGDGFQFTGKTETLHGQTGYEIVMLEGHRQGELLWTYKTPGEYEAEATASRARSRDYPEPVTS